MIYRSKGRYRLTREDIAFTMELLSEGVDIGTIAYFVFGISERTLLKKLRDWKYGRVLDSK